MWREDDEEEEEDDNDYFATPKQNKLSAGKRKHK
jgi:hypothetical protein